MNLQMKRLVSCWLILCLLLAVLPFPAAAEELIPSDGLVTEPIPEIPPEEEQYAAPVSGWTYSANEPRPHVLIEQGSEIGTMAANGITLNFTSITLDEGWYTSITATAASGQTISWQTSNSSVATVGSVNGVIRITAVKAGTATITASTVSGESATCSVTVTVADNTYYIKNSSLYLAVDGSLLEYAPLKLLDQQSTGPAKIRQLWKLQYVGNGFYGIRSLYKLDMALYSSDSNQVSITKH